MKWFDLLLRLAQAALGQVMQALDYWRWQLFQILLLALLAAVCGLAVLLLVALTVVLVYWETHRFEALWALILIYTLLTAALVRRAGRLMAPPTKASFSRRQDCAHCGGCAARAQGACRGR